MHLERERYGYYIQDIISRIYPEKKLTEGSSKKLKQTRKTVSNI